MNKATKKDTKPVPTKTNDRAKSKENNTVKSTKKVKDDKAKKAKKTDKENGVKRNKSAYQFFCDEMRPKITAENKEVKGKDVMKVS
jgi:hypothetical protein